jgi:hypothetical protein
MRVYRIVKSFDVSEYVHHSMYSGGEMAQVDTLTFESLNFTVPPGVYGWQAGSQRTLLSG